MHAHFSLLPKFQLFIFWLITLIFCGLLLVSNLSFQLFYIWLFFLLATFSIICKQSICSDNTVWTYLKWQWCPCSFLDLADKKGHFVHFSLLFQTGVKILLAFSEILSVKLSLTKKLRIGFRYILSPVAYLQTLFSFTHSGS